MPDECPRADELRWNLLPLDPLALSDDDRAAEHQILQACLSLALDRLYTQTQQLEAARRKIHRLEARR